MSRRSHAWIAGCLLLLSGHARARQTQAAAPDLPPPVPPAQRVTLEQAVVEALKANPQVLAAAHTTAGANANLAGQRAPLNPILSYSGVNNAVAPLNLSNPDNYAVEFTLETSGRQHIRTKQAKAQLEGAQADQQTSRLTVREAAQSAYLALQVADSALQNEQQAYDTAKRLSSLTESQFKLGAAPETNAIRSSIALTQEEQNLYTAVQNVLLARASLNQQMGRAPDLPIDVAEPLAYKPIRVNLEALQQQALQSRPEIRSAEATRRELQATVQMQRSQYYPDLLLESNLRADQLFAGVALPLFDFGSIRGAVGKAKEDVKVQEAQETQVRQQVLLDVQTAYANLMAAQRTVVSFQSGILPRAEALLSKIEQGYQLGANTILDLIDAQETLRTTRNGYYTATGSYGQALAQLERAVGVPVQQITGILATASPDGKASPRCNAPYR